MYIKLEVLQNGRKETLFLADNCQENLFGKDKLKEKLH